MCTAGGTCARTAGPGGAGAGEAARDDTGTARGGAAAARALGDHEGGGAVGLGGLALLRLLLLDSVDTRVVGAVVVAGEEVAVLLAEARVVVWGAAVDLGLFGGDAGVEDAGEGVGLVGDGWRKGKGERGGWGWSDVRLGCAGAGGCTWGRDGGT